MTTSNFSYFYQPGWDMNPAAGQPSLDDPFIFQGQGYDNTPQYLQCAYPQVHTAQYEASLPPPGPIGDGIHRVRCRWGSTCDVMLDDLSAAGLMRHIKEYHIPEPWNKKSRGTCQWESCCGREMAYASFGKHVAVVHLRGSVQCPYCQMDVRRPGLLERHVRNYCQHASGKQPS